MRKPIDHLESGQLLGHYELIRPLYQRGSVEIWEGLHCNLSMSMALKILPLVDLHAVELARAKWRLHEEAQIMASFHHPHIVGFRDYRLSQHFLYLVMQYAPGGSLAQSHLIGRKVPLPLVRLYTWQIAHALSTLHRRGLIHRDIKPGNILLLSEHHTLLADFGLTMYDPSLSDVPGLHKSGTAAYMAPEQANGYPCFASDQYSLALSVYEWLTGHRPFSDELMLMQKRARGKPLSVRRFRPELPSAVDEILEQALQPDPTDRYPAVLDFARDFARVTRVARPPRVNRLPYDRRILEQETGETALVLPTAMPLRSRRGQYPPQSLPL